MVSEKNEYMIIIIMNNNNDNDNTNNLCVKEIHEHVCRRKKNQKFEFL